MLDGNMPCRIHNLNIFISTAVQMFRSCLTVLGSIPAPTDIHFDCRFMGRRALNFTDISPDAVNIQCKRQHLFPQFQSSLPFKFIDIVPFSIPLRPADRLTLSSRMLFQIQRQDAT
ncbi:MAG: hypothetical protein ACLUOI_29550 [Eisenbergiella sp.]